MDTSLINQEWDDIIVGTGMGGATIGHALAKAGRRVLFLEKGEDYITNPQSLKGDFLEALAGSSRSDQAYQNAGRAHLEIWDTLKQRALRPLLGSGTGGSTALYGMVMERFWPHDFEPKRYHPNAEADCSLPDRWPVSFTEMEPYYEQAEGLYGVTSSWPDPLRPEQKFNYRPSPPLGEKPLRLYKFLQRRGNHPYLSPLALDFVSGCQFCQSFLCDKNCKNDAVKVCLQPAIKNHGAALVARCEVFRLEADERRVNKVVVRDDGRTFTLSGKNVILAAGALMTPLLLLRSSSNCWPQGLANRSGLVGRNLMRHYIDLLAVFSRSAFSKNYNLKELALNDFYVVKGEKFGSIGSFGHMPPAFMAVDDIQSDLEYKHSPFLSVFKTLRPLTQALLSRLFAQAGFAALILEDLPYPDNRVAWGGGGEAEKISVEYRVRPSERERIRRFRSMAQRAYSPNPTMLLAQADNLKFLAHACGTCRFGEDPRQSVLNKFNCSHDLENLYIVDSSFFPSSGGTNPALTIAANALRVADHLISKELP